MTARPGLDVPPILPAVLRRSVERYGPREFLISGDQRLTYAQAGQQSAVRARGLLALGLGKGARIGLMAPNGAEWVLNWLAIGRMGGLAVCLSTFFQAREIEWALRHNDIDTLLISARHLNHDLIERLERAVPELATQTSPDLYLARFPYLRRIIVLGQCDRPWALKGPADLEKAAAAQPRVDAAFLASTEAQVTPADDLMIICTSGTTADPKAVVHTHGNVVRNCWDFEPYATPDLTEEDRLYTAMPLFWVGGSILALLPTMFQGAAIIFSESTHAEAVLDVVLRERPTYLILGWSVPGLAREAAQRGADLSFVRFPPPPLPPEQRGGGSLGMTETFGSNSAIMPHLPVPPGKRGTLGPTLGDYERRIVDPETRRTLGPGEVGELEVRGPNLMRGYYKRERWQVFTKDGFFATGDRCSQDEDGYLYFHGRLSEMIKTSGANVAPREVEAVLMQFPEVREAIVFGVPDPQRGEAVAAVIIPQEGVNIDPDDVRARVRTLISAYKAPTLIFTVQEEDLPRTGSGKVKKNELRDRLLARLETTAGDTA